MDQGVPGATLEEAILRMNAMTGIDPEMDSFVASSDLLLHGVTGVQAIFHTFGDPEFYLETLAKTIKGITRTGIRALIILAITDQFEFLPSYFNQNFPLPPFIDAGPRLEPRTFIEIFKEATRKHPDVAFGVGPVAPQWCSDRMMDAIGEIADSGCRIHTHFLESVRQRNWIDENPVARLSRFGLLNERTSLAHAVWTNDSELEEIERSGAHLVACPRSNQVLRSGTAPLEKWIAKRIKFGIGLDSIGGVETSIGVARLLLDESHAVSALTRGGESSTGLPVHKDKVMWKSWDRGIVDSVEIDGKKLVDKGLLINHEEYEMSRKFVTKTLQDGSEARRRKMKDIDDVLPNYIRELDR